jgi:outer membrane biosynthesis protein TonB
MGFISAILLVASAVGIFVAVASKSRSQAKFATPTPYRTPAPSPTPNRAGVDKNIQSRAVSLPKPVLPKGTVVVSQITVEVFVKVDEKGNVTQSQAYTGTEVLKQAAKEAALKAKFKPGEKEQSGILYYEFSPN